MDDLLYDLRFRHFIEFFYDPLSASWSGMLLGRREGQRWTERGGEGRWVFLREEKQRTGEGVCVEDG